MLERQDIDALLVGALYGELTPAEEVRLTQHLDSHPGDRVALDDLTRARTAIRDSRIFAFSYEPPQAVSAILLQEAHRRAPKVARPVEVERSEGWFARFVRTFMAHPAMAAAAMIVLVAGVAGTMYSRHGVKSADETVSTRAEASKDHAGAVAAAEQKPAAEPSVSLSMGSGSSAGTDQFGARLDDNLELRKGNSYKDADGDLGKPQDVVVNGTGKGEAANVAPPPTKTSVPTGITVYHSTPQPKELPPDAAEKKQKIATETAFEDEQQKLSEGGANSVVDAPKQQAPANTTVGGEVSKNDRSARDTTTTKEASDQSLVAWAQTQHARLRKLVDDGKCTEAGELAVKILNRAPDYFSEKIADDRDMKRCAQYINQAREKDAEKSGKSRVKRVNADEPAPAPTTRKP